MEYNYIYSIPYIILILFYGGASLVYHSSKSDKVHVVLRVSCVALFLLFFGFRGFIGDDWTNYYPMFERTSAQNWEDMLQAMQDTAFEPGFFMLTLVCKQVSGESYVFYQFVCSLIVLFLLYRFLSRNLDNIPLGFLLYLCFGGFVMSTNLMRNSISILIFLNAIDFLRRRKAIPYFLLCLLALSFHNSAILYFPLYFFFHKRCPRWLFLLVILGGNAVFLLQVKTITPVLLTMARALGEVYEKLLENYIEGKYGDISAGFSIGLLERTFTTFLVWCYYDKLHAQREENALFVNAMLAYMFLNLFFYEFQIVGQRLANLFVFFYWVIWVDLIRCFSIRGNKLLYISFMGVYCVLKIAGLTCLETYRYDNFLLGAKSYEERLYIHQKYEDDDE